MDNELFSAKCRDFDENYKTICENIALAAEQSGRCYEDITLLAATKTVDVSVINYAYKKGIKVIGENRVQEFLSKEDELDAGLRRQLIGTLQTNKVNKIVGKVELIQSVDSVKLAKEIDRVSALQSIVSDVLVEVNIAYEQSKSGIDSENLSELLYSIGEMKNIRVKGLMTLGPVGEPDNVKAEYFTKMQKLFIDNSGINVDNISMDILSMGMSDDYALAIKHGATMVRVGSSLFGKRIYN